MATTERVEEPAATGQVTKPSPARQLATRVPWETVASLVVVFSLWEVIGRTGRVRAIPAITEINASWMEIYRAGGFSVVTTSIATFAIGTGAAIGAAAVVATLMHFSKTLDYVLRPYIDAGMSVPITATIPLLMLIFGLGMATRVVVVFLYAFFLVVVSIQAGLEKVDPANVEMADTFGASAAQRFWKITIPSAFPYVMNGIRLGVSRGMRGMVSAEVIISTAGIGWLLVRSSRTFDLAGVYAVTATIVLAALLLMGIFGYLERRVFRVHS